MIKSAVLPRVYIFVIIYLIVFYLSIYLSIISNTYCIIKSFKFWLTRSYSTFSKFHRFICSFMYKLEPFRNINAWFLWFLTAYVIITSTSCNSLPNFCKLNDWIRTSFCYPDHYRGILSLYFTNDSMVQRFVSQFYPFIYLKFPSIFYFITNLIDFYFSWTALLQ